MIITKIIRIINFSYNWNNRNNRRLLKSTSGHAFSDYSKNNQIRLIRVHTFSSSVITMCRKGIKRQEKPKHVSWNEEHAKFIIKLFVKEYDKYKNNKASTARAWANKLAKHEKYKALRITDLQVKNWIAIQVSSFHKAMKEKNSTGFDDKVDVCAKNQLKDICKYKYKMHLLY